jgi:hypothetical protein
VKRALRLGLCGVALAAGGCTRVVDAVTAPGASTVCTQQSTDPDCAPTSWPTVGHTANSDPWLVTHNEVITSMAPAVLVLNFDNGVSAMDTGKYAGQVAAALAVGSTYHGYSNPAAMPFLNYVVTQVVDLTDSTTAGTQNQNLPVTDGAFDPTALFSAQFAASYGYVDPTNPSRYLTLCELFEQGLINEVWIQDGESPPRRSPLYAEYKQEYDDNGLAIPNKFDDAVGGGSVVTVLSGITCGVTVRIAHLDPSPSGGVGCDVYVRGWGIEGMWQNALPALNTDAAAFLNQDFDTRFGVRFSGWPDICDAMSAQAGVPCVTYTSPTSATGTYPNDGTSWAIAQFYQGCGSSQFPPNAIWRGDFGTTTPAVAVDSRCEHFGLGGGANGGDLYEPYTAGMVSTLEPNYPASQCGADWQIYWRQNMPGYGNQAKTHDGQPMENWWPVLFY